VVHPYGASQELVALLLRLLALLSVHIDGQSPMSFVSFWRDCAEHLDETIPPQVQARYDELYALGKRGTMFQKDTIRSLGVQVKGNDPVDLNNVLEKVKEHGLMQVVEFGQRIQLAAVDLVHYENMVSNKSKSKYNKAKGVLNSFSGLTVQQYVTAHAGSVDSLTVKVTVQLSSFNSQRQRNRRRRAL